MFNIDKSINKIIGIKKFGGKKDWDGDGVPNKKDCQPYNVVRQDKIKKPYAVVTNDLIIGYGSKVIKNKQSTTTIQDVKNVFKKYPELKKKSKGLYAVMIESYKSPHYMSRKNKHSRAKFTHTTYKGKIKPIIVLKANPYKDNIEEYGRKKANELHKKETAKYIAHELVHYTQEKIGKLKMDEPYSQKVEDEAIQKMKKYRVPVKEYITHYYSIWKREKGGFGVHKYKTKEEAEKDVRFIKKEYGYYATVISSMQYNYLLNLNKPVTINMIKNAKRKI